MGRFRRAFKGYLWVLSVAVLAVAITAGVTAAQDVEPPAPEPEVVAAQDVATQLEAIEPVAPPPAPEPPATPEPPAQPAPEPAPATTTQEPAPEAQGAPAPNVQADVAPAAPGGGETAEAPTAPAGPAAPSGEQEQTRDPATGPGRVLFGNAERLARNDVSSAGGDSFENNPCRQDPSSAACARFLYPNLCRVPSSSTCVAVTQTNPCVSDPSGRLCQNFLEAACRTEPNSSRCFTIRVLGLIENGPPPGYEGRWSGQENPCRSNNDTDECRDWLADVGNEWCRYTGLTERESCIALLVFFQLPSESRDEREPGVLDCLTIRANFPNAQPPSGSVCEFYLATEFDACSRDVPAILCTVRFGGSTERLGIEGAEDAGRSTGGRSGSKPLIGGRRGDRRGDDLVPDPGGERRSRPLTGDDDRGRTRRSRAAERLPRSGADLEAALLAGLLLLGAGALMRRANMTTRRPEA